MPQNHYWIHGTHNGQPFLYYGGVTESEASAKGYEIIDCYFDIIQLNTRSVTEASRRLKGQKLSDTGDLDYSLKRLRHTTR